MFCIHIWIPHNIQHFECIHMGVKRIFSPHCMLKNNFWRLGHQIGAKDGLDLLKVLATRELVVVCKKNEALTSAFSLFQACGDCFGPAKVTKKS